jgi:hypothetical protein
MKKIKSIECLTLLLLAVIFCMPSCERPIIKPEHPETPEVNEDVSNSSPSDRFVGTWVRYWNSDTNDTLKFTEDGIFIYSLGEYNSDGSVYTDEYHYECSDNFLFYYKNPSSYGFNTNYIKFYDGDTAFTFYNFTLYPGPQVTMIYNITYKKID